MKKSLLKVLIILLSIQAFPVTAEETYDTSVETAIEEENAIQNETVIPAETTEPEEVAISVPDEESTRQVNAELLPPP